MPSAAAPEVPQGELLLLQLLLDNIRWMVQITHSLPPQTPPRGGVHFAPQGSANSFGWLTSTPPTLSGSLAMQDQRATHALTAMMSVNINWVRLAGGRHPYIYSYMRGYTPIVCPDICMCLSIELGPLSGFIVSTLTEIGPKNVTDIRGHDVAGGLRGFPLIYELWERRWQRKRFICDQAWGCNSQKNWINA